MDKVKLLGQALCLGMFIAALGSAHAQVKFEHEPYSLTLDGYANLSGAHNTSEDNTSKPKEYAVRIDAGLRALGLWKTEAGLKLGTRVELLSSKEDELEVGERSILVISDCGRFEVGKRQGLPDVLSGYAPNGYTFTSAEFGLSSGRTLDPGGNLPTSFLSPSLGAQIDGISSLGFAATFFGDRSGKVIYVSPKKSGWEAGIAFSPRAEELGGKFKRLLQTGLVHESYFGEHVFRIGGSYTQAEGQGDVTSGCDAGGSGST